MLDELRNETRTALLELLDVAKLRPGDLFVLGASSSEIMGERIGSASSMEAAEAVLGEIVKILKEQKIFLAVQCCEHLNRCLIVEEEAAERHQLEQVNAVPHAHAGGAFATTAYSWFEHPVAVEHIRAKAGMDIGQTFIGMHMAPVVVPVRTSVRKIGEATLSLCRVRPKFVGGERAQYDPSLK